MIKTDAHLFAVASRFTSIEETRPYLQGVYVEPHRGTGVMLVATDGTRLIGIHDTEGFAEKPAIVRLSKTTLAACSGRKTDRTKYGNAQLKVDADADGYATVSQNGLTLKTQTDTLVDGVFPDWRRAVPSFGTKVDDVTPSFQEEHLKSFLPVGKLLTGKDSLISIHPYGQHEPALITWPVLVNAFGVLMPTRGLSTKGVPHFMKEILDAA